MQLQYDGGTIASTVMTLPELRRLRVYLNFYTLKYLNQI